VDLSSNRLIAVNNQQEPDVEQLLQPRSYGYGKVKPPVQSPENLNKRKKKQFTKVG
jgi:hypothetical protein